MPHGRLLVSHEALGNRPGRLRIGPTAGLCCKRPYQAGSLFRTVRGVELPDWSRGFADSWGQFFLKFIVSHPAVTCVIPATSKPHHMRDNLEAGFGRLPDDATRERMVGFVQSL